MKNNFILCYKRSHETFRQLGATGEAAPTSDLVAREGDDLIGSGSTSRVLRKLRFPTAAGFSKGRGEGSGLQSLSGSSSRALERRKETTGEPFDERFRSIWVHHRSLNHAAGGRGNSHVLWSSLSSQPPLVTPDGAGIELSEARTPGSGNGRGGDRTLEEETVAGDKKAFVLGAHLTFLDESGFLLIPNVCRTWAPRGQTPVLHHFCR